jgi:DNA-binding transcriptional LysR family regulator
VICMVRNKLKYMESVIALSEELNFTRAARKIRISQPTLTRNVAEAERLLGFHLFDRDHSNVHINDAGRAYVKQAKIAVLHSERALQDARAAMQNADVVLNVGKSPYIDPYLISMLLSIQLPLFPNLRINLSSHYSCDLMNDLLAGTIDMAIANDPPEYPQISTVKVAESPFYLAIAESDELSRLHQLTMREMTNRCWVLFERRVHPILYDAVLERAQEKKVKPLKVHHIMTAEEAYPLVVQDHCVAFLTKPGAVRIARSGVTLRPLNEEGLLLHTLLAARADDESRVISELERALIKRLSAANPDAQLPLPLSA